jgi:hypothetical protein
LEVEGGGFESESGFFHAAIVARSAQDYQGSAHTNVKLSKLGRLFS